MYWDLELSNEELSYNFGSIFKTEKILTILSEFEIDQTMRIRDNFNFGGVVGFTKTIRIGGE